MQTRLLINGDTPGTSSVELNGNNTFTGDVTIRGGTLLLGHNNALGTSAGNLYFGDGGGGGGRTMSLLTSGLYTIGETIRFENASGGAYTVIVGGNHTSGTSTFSGTIAWVDTAASTYRLTAAAGGTVVFTGLIDDGALTKALTMVGDGTVILGRATGNTFDGGMTVSAGTLLVNNTTGSGTGSGTVTVNSGATLGGAGRIGGNTTVNGTLAPGASPGTLTFDANLTLAGSATLAFELNGQNATVGGGVNYLVVVGGNLTLAGTLNMTETVAGSFMNANAGDTWRLFNYSGSLTDNGLTLGTMPSVPSGYEFVLDAATGGRST